MNAHHDPDRLLDEALKHELGSAGAAPASGSCLDAETVAAWMDGGLDSQAIALNAAHASNCARCQALLGTLARTTPAVVATEPQGARLWRWWFAPLVASAAAVTLWMVVPREPVPTPASSPAMELARAEPSATRTELAPAETPPAPADAPTAPAAPAPASTTPPAAARERANAATPAPKELGKLTADKRDALAFEELERKAEASARADSAAEGRVAAAAPPAAALRSQADPQVTARSSPSPGVIWLVGRAGMVQLATDGRTFARVPFPEAVDLTAVTATDERHAIVTTADGRAFQTADGGRTWRRP